MLNNQVISNYLFNIMQIKNLYQQRWFIVFISILGIFLQSSCASKTSDAQKQEQGLEQGLEQGQEQGRQQQQGQQQDAGQGLSAVEFPTEPIRFINPSYEISVPAELKAYEQVSVFAKVSGFVKTIYVDRGDRVSKGQLLAVLEAPEIKQKYLSDKSTQQQVYADYLFAKQAYDRLEEAAQTSGAVAAIELERAAGRMMSAKSAYEAAQAGTAQAAELQQYLRITAPFDGIITERNISVGALVGMASSQYLFKMAQSDRLRLTVSLPERHAAAVQLGMPATFTISSQPGREFETKLSRTAGFLQQNDRSLALEFDVQNTDKKIQGGDYAQVKLKLKREQPTFWVKNSAVLKTQSGLFVLQLKDQEIIKINITEGIRVDSLTEIFGNLTPEAEILIKPSEEIREGKIN